MEGPRCVSEGCGRSLEPYQHREIEEMRIPIDGNKTYLTQVSRTTKSVQNDAYHEGGSSYVK